MSVPTIDHPTDRPNFTIVRMPNVALAFSYQTVIGFYPYDGEGWRVSANLWGNTTGKHINYLNDDTSARLERDEFEKQLAEVTA